MKTITFITGNINKLSEAQSIVGTDILLEQEDIDLPEIQTTNVKEVIEAKLKAGYEILKKPIIVEDTGLEFQAWNGLPGALVKFFIKSVGVQGLIDMLQSYENKNAKVVCYVGYFDGENSHYFCGEIEGTISPVVIGESGFQFDKIFIPNGEKRTFSQMSKEEKNAFSHRKRAFEKFQHFLENQQ